MASSGVVSRLVTPGIEVPQMTTKYADPVTADEQSNMVAARRLVEGFNSCDWEAVGAVIAPDFVFHHPLGGTVAAGPEGMVSTWAGFKRLSPDSWHPTPIMIAEGDFIAVLLPTYGTYSGGGPMSSPTNGRLDYGMVNMFRLEEGKIAEMWFGMDPLVEMQQMGLAPQGTRSQLSRNARINLGNFLKADAVAEGDFDTVAAFDEVVVALGPPQDDPATMTRWVEVYQMHGGLPELVYSHEIRTDPPHTASPAVAKEISRNIVEQWFDQVLNCHSRSAVEALAAEHILIHPTAMPCEAAYYGADGAMKWLSQHWAAFGDLTFSAEFSVAHGEIVAVRWKARGISRGEFMGQAPTGKPIEFSGLSMYRVEHGKIAEIWETRNTFAVLHALNPEIGAVPAH
jgi:predicted ester cyclase